LRSLARVSARVPAIAVCVVIGGCGSAVQITGAKHDRQALSAGRPRLLGKVSTNTLLARGRLPGGYFSWSEQQYDYDDRAYIKIGDTVEEARRHAVSPISGGAVSLLPNEYGSQTLGVKYGCLAKHEFALAYGLVRDRGDTVIARERQGIVVLKEKPLPSIGRRGGVFVYSSALQWPLDLTTRTPSGRIADEETYIGPGSKLCSS
jgi:hypothetical protein